SASPPRFLDAAHARALPPFPTRRSSDLGLQTCGCGSVGRASPCQGEGRGFESRHPLGGGGPSMETTGLTSSPGGLAERRGSGLQSRIHGFESRTHLAARAIGAAVARFLDTEEVTGSNPVSPTTSDIASTRANTRSQPPVRQRRRPYVHSCALPLSTKSRGAWHPGNDSATGLFQHATLLARASRHRCGRARIWILPPALSDIRHHTTGAHCCRRPADRLS